MAVEVSLTQGQVSLIDEADAERVLALKWFAHRVGKDFYARRNQWLPGEKRYHALLLHRFILDAPAGMDVDHINRDTLDNRRCNIRIVTRSENNANHDRRRRANQHGFHGIAQHRYGFLGRIQLAGQTHHTRVFPTAEEAARAWDALAVRLHGSQFIDLNFPREAA